MPTSWTRSEGKIKALSLNGIVPSTEHVQHKTYTLTRDSFLVTQAPPSPAVANFDGVVVLLKLAPEKETGAERQD